MSQHHVEDLVEDSIRSVLRSQMPAAEQRRRARELFAFQGLFDTSDTLGRVEKDLRAIGFFEEASPIDAPAPLGIVAAMMAEAERQGDLDLAHHWLALLIESLDEGEFEGAIPQSLAELAGLPEAAAIRDIAIRHGLGGRRPRNGYIALRSWASVKPYQPPSLPAEIERTAILRYFADLKAPLSTIEAERDKRLVQFAARSLSPFHRLPELGALPEALTFIRKIENDETTTFLFALPKASPQDDSRIYFKVEQNSELGIVVGEFWVVSETLLRWQRREEAAEAGPVHFKHNYFSLVPEEEIASSRSIHPMGGWKYRLGQSQKVLLQRLSEITSVWPRCEPLLDFHRRPLVQRLLDTGLETALAERLETAETYGFFRVEIEILFAFACLGRERGEDIAPIIARLEQAFEALSPNNQKRTIWREGLDSLKAGAVWFPPELAGILPSCRL